MGSSLAIALCLGSVGVVSAKPFDLADAEARFSHLGKMKPGVEYNLISDRPMLGLESDFANRNEYALYQRVCSVDFVVRAKSLNSTSFLTSDRRQILTRSEFVISEVIRANTAMSAGSQITLVQLGGEVREHGVRLEMRNASRIVFRPKQEYLLFLNRSRMASSDNFYPDKLSLELLNGQVLRHSGWLPAAYSVFRYSDLKTELQRLEQLHPCPGQDGQKKT
ncbi:hypothetical protein [Undibacterium rugosum]|uniref:hypothetical protein n=1 Tax=Undibacterium rugosum TaxID=2762291 RepID=UPI001B83DCC2|nr:hypothetical protein [Undibacterium rugosum]MBR7777405.1 hypothetical protein [Undibacterium rugosum]